MQKTVYFQYFKFLKGHNSNKNYLKLTTHELHKMFIRRKWHTKFQLNISKHQGEKCGKLWLRETRTDGHHHTIIRPVWRRAYKKHFERMALNRSCQKTITLAGRQPSLNRSNGLSFSKVDQTSRSRSRGHKGAITIVADFSPEFNLQFRWCSEHQPKNHRAYQ